MTDKERNKYFDGRFLECVKEIITVVERIGLGVAYKLACRSLSDCDFKDFYSLFEEDAY